MVFKPLSSVKDRRAGQRGLSASDWNTLVREVRRLVRQVTINAPVESELFPWLNTGASVGPGCLIVPELDAEAYPGGVSGEVLALHLPDADAPPLVYVNHEGTVAAEGRGLCRYFGPAPQLVQVNVGGEVYDPYGPMSGSGLFTRYGSGFRLLAYRGDYYDDGTLWAHLVPDPELPLVEITSDPDGDTIVVQTTTFDGTPSGVDITVKESS